MIKQYRRKKLPSSTVRIMQKKENARTFRNRKIGMLHNQLVAPTRPELTIYAKVEKLLKTGRRVIDAMLFLNDWHAEVFEYYVKSTTRPNFVPKTKLTKKLTIGNLNVLIADCGKSHLTNGVMKFNKLASHEFVGEKYTVESWIGYIPKTNFHNNATFETVLETKPKGFFVFIEMKHKKVDAKHTQHTHTRFIVSSSYVWLKAVVDKREKPARRFAELLPKNLKPNIFPTKPKLKIVKSKRTIRKF